MFKQKRNMFMFEEFPYDVASPPIKKNLRTKIWFFLLPPPFI